MVTGLCCDHTLLLMTDEWPQLQLVIPGPRVIKCVTGMSPVITAHIPHPINNFLQTRASPWTEDTGQHMMFYQSIVQRVISHIGITIMTPTIKYWLI